MSYYAPTIDALDKKIQELFAAQPYPVIRENTEVFQPSTLKLPNSEAIAHYENEVRFVDFTLAELGRIIEPHGLILSPDANNKYGYDLRYMAASCPRTCKTDQSPLAPLVASRQHEAYRALDGYLNELQGRIPVFPAAAQMYQAVEQLLEYKGICKRSLAGLDKGERGENLVLENLNKTSFKYLVRSGVVLPAVTGDSQTSETDAYVITPKGIFVLEIKNKGNGRVTFSISKDGRWTELRDGRVKHIYGENPMDKSPSEQNVVHKINTEAFLEKHGFKEVPLYPVVVFANNEVEIKNESHDVVLRSSALISYIESIDAPNLLSMEQMVEIARLFDSEGMEARAFDVYCLSHKSEEINRYLESLLRVFYEQKQAEKKIGALLADTVDQIVNNKDEGTRQAAEQSRKKSINLGKNTVLTLIRAALTLVFCFAVFDLLDEAVWLKSLLYNAGYLWTNEAWRVETSSLIDIKDNGVLAGIWIISVIGSGLTVWILPHLVWQNLKRRNKTYFHNSLANALLLIVIYFATLIVLANGIGYLAIAGFAILLYFGWRIWHGKFLILVKNK